MTKTLDLITIGRSSVDLYGDQIGGRLEDMGSFSKYIGGSPTNIACGTARLGLKSAVITGVGDEHMGRFIVEQLAREGVDTRGVKVDPERLTALVLLGIRDDERFPLIFYRENCADMGLTEADIDEGFIAEARAVLATGTHLSHPRTEAAVLKALTLARKHGARTALDIDYRPNLWGVAGHGEGESRFVESEAVTRKLQATLHLFDLIVGTEEEFHIAGGSTDTIAALRAVRAVSDATLVCKRGAAGAVAFEDAIPDSLDDGQTGPGFPIEVFNVLGAGDGFFSGLLRGWLTDRDWPTSLKFANACGAFAVSRHGCTPAYPSLTELEFFLDRGVVRPDLRNDAALEQVHWATNRQREHGGDWSEMRVFAFDHRMQLEEMDGATPEKIGAFKQLCLRAALEVRDGRPGYGILCDNRLGRAALHAASGTGLWVGRPCEWPGSRPLTLEPELGSDFGGLERMGARGCGQGALLLPPGRRARAAGRAGGDGEAALGGLAPQPAGVPARDHPLQGRPGGRRHHRDADPAVLRRRCLAGLVEARADDLARRLGERHRGDRGARRPYPRHRRARSRRPGGRARGELRDRRRLRSGEGLRGRPDDLRRRGAGLDEGRGCR